MSSKIVEVMKITNVIPGAVVEFKKVGVFGTVCVNAFTSEQIEFQALEHITMLKTGVSPHSETAATITKYLLTELMSVELTQMQKLQLRATGFTYQAGESDYKLVCSQEVLSERVL